MSSQPHERFLHEGSFFDTTAALIDAAAPLLRETLARGEDVALVCTDSNNRALRESLGDDERIIVLPRPQVYEKAVTAVAYYRDFMQDRVEGGSTAVSMVGQVDFGTDSRWWDEWRRFEALMNHALPPFPLRTLCAYNTEVLPDPVLATGELTHPFLRRDGVTHPNPAYVDPAELLRLPDPGVGLLLDLEPAAVIAEVVALSRLHVEVTALLAGEGFEQDRVQDVVLAVHEIATNALRHGRAPVTVRVWLSPGRVVCTVTDRGEGFDDPLAGYVRGGGEPLPEGRFGLWLARELCDELVTARTPEGFTARLVLRR